MLIWLKTIKVNAHHVDSVANIVFPRLLNSLDRTRCEVSNRNVYRVRHFQITIIVYSHRMCSQHPLASMFRLTCGAEANNHGQIIGEVRECTHTGFTLVYALYNKYFWKSPD